MVSLRTCPQCGKQAVAKVFLLGYYQAEDPDDEDNILYKSDDIVVEDEFPKCRVCYWNSDGAIKWNDFANVQ